jgi:predicted ATPase
MDRFVIISGCSGGGKSTLLNELQRRGFAVIEEPGRRIVEHEMKTGGSALPWINGAAFARRAIDLSISDLAAAEQLPGWVFFDRGLIDAASYLQHLTGKSLLGGLRHVHRYNKTVFLTPPWREIYANDDERRHGFADAVAEYERLYKVYPSLSYEISLLPKTDVVSRADVILTVLQEKSPIR